MCIRDRPGRRRSRRGSRSAPSPSAGRPGRSAGAGSPGGPPAAARRSASSGRGSVRASAPRRPGRGARTRCRPGTPPPRTRSRSAPGRCRPARRRPGGSPAAAGPGARSRPGAGRGSAADPGRCRRTPSPPRGAGRTPGPARARTARGPVFFPLRAAATAYVDIFRGLPLILVLLLVGFGLPGLRLQGIPRDAVALGGIALVLTYSAYVAEVFRAGIESVHPSQVAAARSLGLSRAQTMRTVVLPQAVRRVIPPLLNDLVALQKDSGLISILGAIDAVRAAQIQTNTYANFTPYVVAGVLFVLLTIPLTRFTDALARRTGWMGAIGGLAGGGALR